MDYESALASGKIKPLRLAFLGRDSKIHVTSVHLHEFTDKYFAKIGVCSYTWGHVRVDWYDQETGLTWKISDRAENMCRAALQYFDRVWIDGLCMVQAWPQHIQDNMKFMGKLYFHGTSVPESIIGLKPDYFYRGWVQQEISFTKMIYVIEPLKCFLESDVGKDEMEFCKRNIFELKSKGIGGFGRSDIFQDRLENALRIQNLFNECLNYLLGLQRILQGRELSKLADGIENLFMRIEPGSIKLHPDGNDKKQRREINNIYNLFHELGTQFLSAMSLTRDTSKVNVVKGALESYRTGFFRYNSDRIVASLSLAQYVLGMDRDTLLANLDKYEPTNRSHADCVIANPGRWCTGLAPVAELKTVNFLQLSVLFLPFHKPDHNLNCIFGVGFNERAHLDKLFSVLHSCDIRKLEAYEYVMGYKKIDEFAFNLYLGLKTSTGSVLGLLSVTRQLRVVTFDLGNSILGGSPEWMMRTIALLNSSYHVHCLGAEEHAVTQSVDHILDNFNDLPGGDYFKPIYRALRHISFAFGVLLNVASYHDGGVEVQMGSVDVKEALDSLLVEEKPWGSESWEHTDF